MIFSRVGRSLGRSGRALHGIGGGYGRGNLYLGYGGGGGSSGMELVRSYLTSVGGVGRSGVAKRHLLDLDSGFRRFFCSEARKRRNYENYHPKYGKEMPKEGDPKAASKDGQKADNKERFQSDFRKRSQDYAVSLIISFIVLKIYSGRNGQEQMKKVSREKIEYFKRRLESWRQNSDDLVSSQSVKEEEEVVTIAGENVEENVYEEWPSILGDNVENEEDAKQEEADDEWPSSRQEEYVEEEDVKNGQDEYDEWPSVQDKEYYAEEEPVRAAQDEQTREEVDEERPFDVDEENAHESVQRPQFQEAEKFEEVDVEKRKGKRWWRHPSSVLNKPLLVSALLILALFCGLCIYSSSSVTYQNDGVALSLKLRMSLPHPSWFRVGKLVNKVASSSVHTLIQISRLPCEFMYMADCNCDGRLTPT